ncbi:MAG: lipid II flippase MurJ [Candidatus Aenigmarchaeota archaeon]|nr:hypothetical protein [Candidatus Aenigmarchaeota archaeon]MDW8149104.1 lipid II flippase MurJ [Candidatus Aenigmarchaeota archaeon]
MKKIFFLFSFFFFFSKILGIIREILFANFLGTSSLADIIRFSFNYYIFVVHLFTMDAFYNTLVPYVKKTKDFKYFRNFVYTLTFFFFIVGFVSVISSEKILSFIKTPTHSDKYIFLSFLPFSIFYFLYIVATGYELSIGEYTISSLRPVIQNIGFIFGLLMYAIFKVPFLIGFFITVSYIFSLLMFLLIFKKKKQEPFLNKEDLVDSKKETKTTFFNLFFFQLFWNITFIYENITAGKFGSGEIAGLNYVKALIETLPILVSVPFSNIFLIEYVLDIKKDKNRLLKLIYICSLVGFCVFILFLFFGKEILHILFYRGSFDQISLKICHKYLITFSFGVVGYLNFFLFQRFFSIHNLSGYHLKIGFISQILNIVGLAFLPKIYGAYSIGVAFSVSQNFYFLLALNKLKKL